MSSFWCLMERFQKFLPLYFWVYFCFQLYIIKLIIKITRKCCNVFWWHRICCLLCIWERALLVMSIWLRDVSFNSVVMRNWSASRTSIDLRRSSTLSMTFPTAFLKAFWPCFHRLWSFVWFKCKTLDLTHFCDYRKTRFWLPNNSFSQNARSLGLRFPLLLDIYLRNQSWIPHDQHKACFNMGNCNQNVSTLPSWSPIHKTCIHCTTNVYLSCFTCLNL